MHPVSLKYAPQCVGVLQFERKKKILVAYVFSVTAYRQEGATASSVHHYCRLVATLALKLLFVMYIINLNSFKHSTCSIVFHLMASDFAWCKIVQLDVSIKDYG